MMSHHITTHKCGIGINFMGIAGKVLDLKKGEQTLPLPPPPQSLFLPHSNLYHFVQFQSLYLVTSPIIWPSELTTAPPLPPGWTAAVVSSITGNCPCVFPSWLNEYELGIVALTTFATTPEQTDGKKPVGDLEAEPDTKTWETIFQGGREEGGGGGGRKIWPKKNKK